MANTIISACHRVETTFLSIFGHMITLITVPPPPCSAEGFRSALCTETLLHSCAKVSHTLPVLAVTALAGRISEGATTRLLSDVLSFSSHRGSAESSHHLYDVPFLAFTLLSVPGVIVP